MAITVTGNINASGQALQIWLNREVLKNFEPQLRFYEMGEKPIWQDGYRQIAWTRVQRLTVSSTAALLTEGVTPTETDLRMETIAIVPKQYGLYVTVSDILIDSSAIALLSAAAKVVGENMGRIIDQSIQSVLELTGTNVIYAGAATSRVTITAADVLRARDLGRANAFLSTKAAPTYDDSYVGVMHPNVIYDLQQEAGTGTYIDLQKYTNNVEKVFKGEIGKLFNVRVVGSAWIQTFASTVTVYPTYIMGKGAYGVGMLQSLQTYMTPRSATDSDPLAQRVKVGAKVAHETIILQQNALIRIESASALNFSF